MISLIHGPRVSAEHSPATAEKNNGTLTFFFNLLLHFLIYKLFLKLLMYFTWNVNKEHIYTPLPSIKINLW